MEKRTPHCALNIVKEMISQGKVRMTHTAWLGASQMGFSRPEMINVVMNLTTANFYKSMTTHADHTIWQDVYHAPTELGLVYLKLTVIQDVLIVSFKEK